MYALVLLACGAPPETPAAGYVVTNRCPPGFVVTVKTPPPPPPPAHTTPAPAIYQPYYVSGSCTGGSCGAPQYAQPARRGVFRR